MKFEWDEAKNQKNIRKHGVSFEKAVRVFDDPNALTVCDPFEFEERWDVVGMADCVLFVVYAEREGDIVRIISARKATKEEVNVYKNDDIG